MYLIAKYRIYVSDLKQTNANFQSAEHGRLVSDTLNPLPHGHIYSSKIPLRLIPQVEGQILRPNAPWCFLDRTSYKPSSSRYEIALYGLEF